MNKEKKPLYRKLNRTPIGEIRKGGKYKWERSKHKNSDVKFERMQKRGHGWGDYDYAPLYYFLLSKVGQDWTKIHSEAIKRLPNIQGGKDHIWDIVFTPHEFTGNPEDMCPYARIGEDSYYSTLYIDADNKLQKVDPDFHVEKLNNYYLYGVGTPTFNGKKIMNHYTEGFLASCRPPIKNDKSLRDVLIESCKKDNVILVDFEGKHYTECLSLNTVINRYGDTIYYTTTFDSDSTISSIIIRDKKILKNIKEWKISGSVETYCSFTKYNSSGWHELTKDSDFRFFQDSSDKNKFVIDKIVRANSAEDALSKIYYGTLKDYILKSNITVKEY